MKKISNELSKNYFFIMVIVIILYIIPIFYIAKYQYSYTRKEIYNVFNYLEHEFSEPEHSNLSHFLSEILEESPSIADVSIIVTYDDTVFKDKNPPELGKLKFKDKIQYYNLKYWVLNKQIKTEYNGVVEVRIIKELTPLIEFFKNLISISFLVLVVLLILCSKIIIKFYNNFIPELKKIEKISDTIQLESFNTIIPNFNTDIKYEEFYSIINSYQKMLERLKKQSELQVDFVNSASHELKTPISILKNYSSLLKKYAHTNTALLDESIETMSGEINNIEKLVQRLLFLSKYGDKSIVFSEENINLNEVIEDVIQELTILHPDQTIYFEKKDCFINTNWVLCKQVVRNILENAIKYGKNNPISIYLAYNSKNAYVYIEDNGIGIEKQNIKFLFNKFYRVNNSDSINDSGYGLGLAIVKAIITSLKGDIFINSIFNKGTIVKIMFKR